MNRDDITSGAKKTDSSIKYDSEGNIIDFGGWESEEAKLINRRCPYYLATLTISHFVTHPI